MLQQSLQTYQIPCVWAQSPKDEMGTERKACSHVVHIFINCHCPHWLQLITAHVVEGKGWERQQATLPPMLPFLGAFLSPCRGLCNLSPAGTLMELTWVCMWVCTHICVLHGKKRRTCSKSKKEGMIFGSFSLMHSKISEMHMFGNMWSEELLFLQKSQLTLKLNTSTPVRALVSSN